MSEVSIVNVKPQLVLGMRKRGEYPSIGVMIPQMCQFAAQNGIQMIGPPTFICHEMSPEEAKKADKEKEIENARTKYLEEKAAEYDLQPVALGLFGGVYNFNKMGWFFRKSMSAVKPQLEAAGVPETEPGLYDTRDLDAIRGWAKDLAQKVND